MAASLSITTRVDRHNARVLTGQFTTHTDGTVSGLSFVVGDGIVSQVEIIPGAGGTQPTNNFSFTLSDGNGLDVLAGKGATVSNAAPTVYTFLAPGVRVEAGPLTPAIASAGDSKTGTIRVWLL